MSDETINGGAGDDLLIGGAGNDQIAGGAGNDTAFGGGGSDTITGDCGNDVLFGGPSAAGSCTVRVTYEGGTAGYDNSLGFYVIDPVTGTISDVRFAFASGQDTAVGTTVELEVPRGAVIGAFTVADGAALNDYAALGPGEFLFLDAAGDPASLGDAAPRLFHRAEDGALTPIDGEVYHSAAFGPNLGLNPDSLLHTFGFADNGDGSYTLGFEDLLFRGDEDFDDFIFTVDLAGSDVTLVNAHYDATGDGADGAEDTGDLIAGGDGDDTIHGDDGDDTLSGDAGADVLFGDAGTDWLSGGAGDDTVFGGAGDDQISGGAGRNVLFGGDDADSFVDVTPGDTVFGGDGGVDDDTLDLRGGGRLRVVDLRTDSDGNGFDGTVEYLDAGGTVTGTTQFTNIERIVPCFTPGTAIATPTGERLVETLRVGDRIITRDNGIQEIRWIGRAKLDWATLARNTHLRPVLIEKGALGNGLPERDMLVSPQHRVLVANERTQLYFDEHEVLVAAKHLIDQHRIREIAAQGVTYVHFMCDRHEVVLSNGAWTESFQPGDQTLGSMGNAQRLELFQLFPELADRSGRAGYAAARKTLKRHEARLLAS